MVLLYSLRLSLRRVTRPGLTGTSGFEQSNLANCLSINSVSKILWSSEGWGFSSGGISRKLRTWFTRSQTRAFRKKSGFSPNLSRFSSALARLLPWQSKQRLFMMGSTSASNSIGLFGVSPVLASSAQIGTCPMTIARVKMAIF